MVPCTAMIGPLKPMAYGGGERTGSGGVAGSGLRLHPNVSHIGGGETEVEAGGGLAHFSTSRLWWPRGRSAWLLGNRGGGS